jgi:hypothetical protein
MSKASKSGTVEASITTYDSGDHTVQFTSIAGKIKVQETGIPPREIGLEEAVERMTELSLSGYGVTHKIQTLPAWAI